MSETRRPLLYTTQDRNGEVTPHYLPDGYSVFEVEVDEIETTRKRLLVTARDADEVPAALARGDAFAIVRIDLQTCGATTLYEVIGTPKEIAWEGEKI